jgi:predicted transcriptional regulator
MAKKKLTLNVDDALTEEMKILAVRLKRSVSDITEELYREFLKRRGKVKNQPPDLTAGEFNRSE